MRIGILGGGQLSRMLALAGIPMGLDFCFYEPAEKACASGLGKVYQAAYEDEAMLLNFLNEIDYLTYENENIPVETLNFIETHQKIYPDKAVLQISQDRVLEKNMFRDLKIPTAAFYEVANRQDLLNALKENGYPALLKSRRGGYDGKGQILLTKPDDLSAVSEADCSNAILENYIAFDREFSLIAARSIKGDVRFYDLCENIHKGGILFRTINKQGDPYFYPARDYVDRVLKKFDYVGVMALEFFQHGEQIIANELAPRVHNTGHWTIEAAMSSQFENHLRAMLGYSLGRTDSMAYASMYNIIGQFPDKDLLTKYPELHLHDYQKQARARRKIGHVTCLASHSHAYHRALETLLLQTLES